MDTRNFDQIATYFAQRSNRRGALRLLGVAALGAGGLSLVTAHESEAKRRRKKKKNKNKKDEQQDPQPQTVDIEITSITISPTSVVNHDDVVVAYRNIGTLPASGFRIGLRAVRSDGTARQEEFSLPLALAAGATSTESFQLGCSWLNNGTITARTDPLPISGESNGDTANNTLSVTFGAGVCS